MYCRNSPGIQGLGQLNCRLQEALIKLCTLHAIRYAEAYELGPLAPDSSYEAKVSAKNAYGWSDQSDVFVFYTQGKGKSHVAPAANNAGASRSRCDAVMVFSKFLMWGDRARKST